MVESDVIEEQVGKVTHKEIVKAMQKMKSGKAIEPSKISVEMGVASGKIGIKVMIELCQCALDGRGMPDEWKTSVIVPVLNPRMHALKKFC